jgi:hypothetical protein
MRRPQKTGRLISKQRSKKKESECKIHFIQKLTINPNEKKPPKKILFKK